MKKNNILFYKTLLIFLIFSINSCSSPSYVEIKTDIAETPILNLDQFDKIMITDFLLKKDKPDFDINKEVKEYLAQELEVNTNKETNIEEISPEEENIFKEKNFWVRSFEGEKKGIFVTGSVGYKREIRKALVKDKRKFEDPFTYEDRFAQRKLYALTLDLYFIDSQTGEVLYQRKFNETKAYENPNQTSYFAFFDLIYSIKEKIFRDVLGKREPQKRYLIQK
ncbi:MAG: hypothetical protein R6V00_05330 [Candidatus Aminicenantes bacterium]